MSALIIDTSSWIAYFGDGRRADLIEDALREGRVYLPPVVAAELTSGTLGKRELAELKSLLEPPPRRPVAGHMRQPLQRPGLAPPSSAPCTRPGRGTR